MEFRWKKATQQSVASLSRVNCRAVAFDYFSISGYEGCLCEKRVRAKRAMPTLHPFHQLCPNIYQQNGEFTDISLPYPYIRTRTKRKRARERERERPNFTTLLLFYIIPQQVMFFFGFHWLARAENGTEIREMAPLTLLLYPRCCAPPMWDIKQGRSSQNARLKLRCSHLLPVLLVTP